MKRPAQWAESIFDIAYLLFAVGMGVYYWASSDGSELRLLYGTMAALLVLGDGCHLIPRMMSFFSPVPAAFAHARGLGKCAASITMTLFYVALSYVLAGYYGLALPAAFFISVWTLAALRIALCLFPIRQWIPPGGNTYPILRNIPFVLLGILTAVISVRQKAGAANLFSFMWLAILMSFTFYLPVALFADRRPRIGMLMLPKTLMYVWMLWMGLGL